MLADWQVKAPPHKVHDGRFYEACAECDDPDHLNLDGRGPDDRGLVPWGQDGCPHGCDPTYQMHTPRAAWEQRTTEEGA